jgi:prolyl oligopeptidase
MILMNDLNGIHVVASIRGGGEFGEEWHKAAMKDKR